jgi:hypothetical protein
MRPRQLLPVLILFAFVACVPYADYGGYYPYSSYYGYQSPSSYYYYPYYSNPYGYYYYPHQQRHVERYQPKGSEHRRPSGHFKGQGQHGREGQH